MINADSGRLVRPLLVVEDGEVMLTKGAIEELKRNEITFDDLIQRGMV